MREKGRTKNKKKPSQKQQQSHHNKNLYGFSLKAH